jgi:hypothetical protein
MVAAAGCGYVTVNDVWRGSEAVGFFALVTVTILITVNRDR